MSINFMTNHTATARRRIEALCFTVALSCAGVAQGANWPQFRGADSRGVVADNPRLPERWSGTENVAWDVPVAGRGWSSPIVWGDKIFVTTVVSDGEVEAPKPGLYFGGDRPTPPAHTHHFRVLCLDFATGRTLWDTEVHSGAPTGPVHLKNTYASATPVTDGDRIYADFGDAGLFCLDSKGAILWSKKFGTFKTRFGWGNAASPVLHKDRLYVVNDNEEKSFLVALDKITGKEIWRVDRDEPSNWATPYIWESGKRTELVTPGRKRVRSYDLDGKPLWEFGGMSNIVIPTPFAGHGLLYICSGYVGDKVRPVFAIRPGASGDISLKDGATTNEHVAWYQRTGAPYNPSPILVGDQFYVLYDGGFLTASNARTGAEIYGKQRLNPGGIAQFTASPWSYNGKIFCLSEAGDTYVIAAGPEYRLLGKNSLGEMCMATPAIAGDSLIIRTLTRLFRIHAAK
jgi:outer membrane protein assembly factor BamB